MRKLCIKLFFYYGIVSNAHFEKSTLFRIRNVRWWFFFHPSACSRENYWEASLSSRMQIRIIFFAALIVDPFVFFPRKRSTFIRKGKEVNGTRRRPVGIFFFSLSREDFFSHFTFNGCKGDFFCFASSRYG